jgi:hypothetical protein
MKQTRSQWAVIALFFVSTTVLSAQNYGLPIPRELVSTMMHLWISVKKTPIQTPIQSYSAPTACAISNEITITIAPCADGLTKTELVLAKPVQ